MRISGFGRSAFGLCVATALLAGCGSQLPVRSGDTASAPLQGQLTLAADAKAASISNSKSGVYKVTPPLLYVANSTPTDNDLRVYHLGARDPAPIATITKGIEGPNGDCIDGHGTLYVTNDPDSGRGWVSEYRLGKTIPFKTIEDGINTPAYCAIDAKGNLWVTNVGLNDVAEYLYGSTKPFAKITSGLSYPLGVAIDQPGNLYVANGELGGKQSIEVYSPGGKSPSRTITDGITFPGGIAVDSNGTLYVT